MNSQQRCIIDTEFQKDIFEEEFRSLMLKMQDRSSKFTDLSKQLEECVQNSISINQQQFDKELKSKQKEIKRNKMENEKRVRKIMKEYDLTENQNLALLFAKQQEYLQIYENLYLEQRRFILFFDHDQQTQINHHTILIKEALNEGQLFQDEHKPNISLLFDFLTGKNKQQIQSTHSSFEVLVQQLKAIEDNLLQINNNVTQETSLQQLISKLNIFITVLKSTYQEVEDLLSEMQSIQNEVNSSEKIRKNNITLIQTIMKENQDQKEFEIQESLKWNDSLLKSLYSILEVNRKYTIHQKENVEDMKQIQEMAKLSSINSQNTQQLTRNNTIKQNIQLKKNNTTSLQRLRIYSDHRKDILNSPCDVNTPPTKCDSSAESSFLYQASQYLQKNSTIIKQPSLQTIQYTVSQHTAKLAEKQGSATLSYKNLFLADKKTAIALKCVCPPQCLCQAQIITQVHSCNNQLYINTRGEVMCQQCSFCQNIQDYAFYCPQNRQKNKFKSYQDFFQSFWQHLVTLTMNQQITEFWSTLQVNCQAQWVQSKQQDLHDLTIDQHHVNFISYCPMESKCYHKTSSQQFHACQCPCPFQITSFGELFCKKCHYFGNPQYYVIQCPETKNYNMYRQIDSFINSLDLSYPDFESEKTNSQFLMQLRRYLTKKWR